MGSGIGVPLPSMMTLVRLGFCACDAGDSSREIAVATPQTIVRADAFRAERFRGEFLRAMRSALSVLSVVFIREANAKCG